jgi:hypothetical protein
MLKGIRTRVSKNISRGGNAMQALQPKLAELSSRVDCNLLSFKSDERYNAADCMQVGSEGAVGAAAFDAGAYSWLQGTTQGPEANGLAGAAAGARLAQPSLLLEGTNQQHSCWRQQQHHQQQQHAVQQQQESAVAGLPGGAGAQHSSWSQSHLAISCLNLPSPTLVQAGNAAVPDNTAVAAYREAVCGRDVWASTADHPQNVPGKSSQLVLGLQPLADAVQIQRPATEQMACTQQQQQQQERVRPSEGVDPLDEEILELLLLAAHEAFQQQLQQQQLPAGQPMQLV